MIMLRYKYIFIYKLFIRWAPIDGKTENSSDMHLNFRLSFHPKYLTPVPTAHDHAKTKKAKKEKAKKKEEEKARKELEKQEHKSILKHPMDTKPHYTVKKLDGANLTRENTMNERPNLENGAVHIVSSQGQDVDRTELITHDHEESYTYGAPLEDGSSDDDEGEPVSPLHTSGKLCIYIFFKRIHDINIYIYRHFISQNREGIRP